MAMKMDKIIHSIRIDIENVYLKCVSVVRPIMRESFKRFRREKRKIRSRMYEYQRSSIPAHQQSASSRSSIADEFTKFAKLKEQGAITEE